MLKFIAITLGRGEEKRDEEEAGGEKSRLELRGEKITLLLQLLITIHFLELNTSISTLVRFGFDWTLHELWNYFLLCFHVSRFQLIPEANDFDFKAFQSQKMVESLVNIFKTLFQKKLCYAT